MCPLYPMNVFLTYAALLAITWIIAGSAVVGAVSKSLSSLNPRLVLNNSVVTSLDLKEGELQHLTLYLENIPDYYTGELLLEIVSPDGLEHLKITPPSFVINKNVTTATKPPGFPSDYAILTDASPGKQDGESTRAGRKVSESSGRYMEGELDVSGVFLGFSEVRFVLSDGQDHDLKEVDSSSSVPVKVQRGAHVLDKIFVLVVILLVIIVYINMGCAIDLDVIKETLRRPVAPVVGLLTQYLVMPLLSYGLGYVFLSSTPALWLGLFVTGCSPGGGGSNMWTYLLGGSLDLSVTMTFISTVAAFAAMPLWLWALAPTIFQDGQFDSPPYRNIGMLVLGLIVPISVGLALKRCCPKGASLLKKLLKPLSLFFIIFVMSFGIYAYWFIFQFFTWRVAVCGLCLPLFGFMAGGCAALVLKRNTAESIAISVETGLQNTGLAIGLLKIALSSFAPLGDIAMVVPIAVATLTPVPLLGAYAVVLWRGRGQKASKGDLKHQRSKGDLVQLSTDTASLSITNS
uniref:P3 protein-like n=1 Tax=Hirondellea gigas TaxID=1518452 RepID=A0A2P2HWE9_9CRUS